MNRCKHISFTGFCELVEWRDSVEDKQKAEKIQCVIDRKLECLKRIHHPYWIIFNKVNIDSIKRGGKQTMSWRNTDCIYEGIGHIVDAFQDNLPCKGHIWNGKEDDDFDKKCHKCPLCYEDKWAEEDTCCYIRGTYNAIDKLGRGEE